MVAYIYIWMIYDDIYGYDLVTWQKRNSMCSTPVRYIYICFWYVAWVRPINSLSMFKTFFRRKRIVLIPVKPKSCEHRGDRVSMLFPRSIEKLKARPGSSGAWSVLIVLRFAAHFWGTQIALDSKNEDVSVDLDPISINYNMCFVVCPAPFVVFFCLIKIETRSASNRCAEIWHQSIRTLPCGCRPCQLYPALSFLAWWMATIDPV